MWLHSSSPIFRGNRHEMCMCMEISTIFSDRETGIRKQSEPFQNRARSRNIFGGTSYLMIPLYLSQRESSFYSVGEVYYQDNRNWNQLLIVDCLSREKEIE